MDISGLSLSSVAKECHSVYTNHPASTFNTRETEIFSPLVKCELGKPTLGLIKKTGSHQRVCYHVDGQVFSSDPPILRGTSLVTTPEPSLEGDGVTYSTQMSTAWGLVGLESARAGFFWTSLFSLMCNFGKSLHSP